MEKTPLNVTLDVSILVATLLARESKTIGLVISDESVWFSINDLWDILKITNRKPKEVFDALSIPEWNRGVVRGVHKEVFLPYITVVRLCSAVVNHYNPGDIVGDQEGLMLAYQINEIVFPRTSPPDFHSMCLDRITV